MENIHGSTLKQKIDHRINEINIYTVARELLAVIKYFQEQNVVHRDLSPSNIIFTNVAKGIEDQE